jgi:predicted nucleotidyltransferase
MSMGGDSMTAIPATGEAERARVLAALRGHADQLRRRGVRRLRLTGSVARGEASLDSDVDLIAEIDRATVARFSLLDLAGLELDLAEALGRDVQIITALDELHPLVRASLEAPAIEVLDGG